MKHNQPIGIFDSGIGGLTIANAIRTALPNESLIYFGDTKHLPYGDKSPTAIRQYVRSISSFLLSQGCKALVIACNSASANALEKVKRLAHAQNVPVLDVITPVARAIACSNYRNVGVIATKATVNSGLYHTHIRRQNPAIQVHEVATPLLAPLIEEGLTDTAISRATIAHYLAHPSLCQIDSIILGCTHYPLISSEIAAYLGKKVAIIDTPLIVANALRTLLREQNRCADDDREARHHCYVSDITDNFRTLAKRFFDADISLTLKALL